MRPIGCHRCSRVFREGGVGRVMRKLVFFFCPVCWLDRDACEEFMRRVAL